MISGISNGIGNFRWRLEVRNWVTDVLNEECKMEIGIVKLSIKWNEMLVLGVIIKDMRAYIGLNILSVYDNGI